MNSYQGIRLINFFLGHPEFAINVISQYYPFTKDELKKYSDKLNWVWVSMNEAIVWNEKLYNEFSKKIPLPSLASNNAFPWTEEFIDEHLIELFYLIEDGEELETSMIGCNTSLPWSEQFIEKYEEHWNWSDLAYNESIPFTIELLNKFEDCWDEQCFEYNKRIIADPTLKLHLGITASDNIHSCEYCGQDMEYVIGQSKYLYKYLFTCPNFKWDLYLLKLIKDNIDKKNVGKNILIYLGGNETFSWNLTVLELFQENWNYTTLQMNQVVGQYLAHSIKKSSTIETLMAKLPKYDFDNIKYSIEVVSADDENPYSEGIE